MGRATPAWSVVDAVANIVHLVVRDPAVHRHCYRGQLRRFHSAADQCAADRPGVHQDRLQRARGVVAVVSERPYRREGHSARHGHRQPEPRQSHAGPDHPVGTHRHKCHGDRGWLGDVDCAARQFANNGRCFGEDSLHQAGGGSPSISTSRPVTGSLSMGPATPEAPSFTPCRSISSSPRHLGLNAGWARLVEPTLPRVRASYRLHGVGDVQGVGAVVHEEQFLTVGRQRHPEQGAGAVLDQCPGRYLFPLGRKIATALPSFPFTTTRSPLGANVIPSGAFSAPPEMRCCSRP